MNLLTKRKLSIAREIEIKTELVNGARGVRLRSIIKSILNTNIIKNAVSEFDFELLTKLSIFQGVDEALELAKKRGYLNDIDRIYANAEYLIIQIMVGSFWEKGLFDFKGTESELYDYCYEVYKEKFC